MWPLTCLVAKQGTKGFEPGLGATEGAKAMDEISAGHGKEGSDHRLSCSRYTASVVA